jgi:hypothetical protein
MRENEWIPIFSMCLAFLIVAIVVFFSDRQIRKGPDTRYAKIIYHVVSDAFYLKGVDRPALLEFSCRNHKEHPVTLTEETLLSHAIKAHGCNGYHIDLESAEIVGEDYRVKRESNMGES